MEQTIEERATMYGLSATKYLSDSLRPQAVQRMHDIYKAIATEQKKIDIEKADRWLRTHLPRVISNYPLGDGTTNMLNEDMREEFIKAMEQ